MQAARWHNVRDIRVEDIPEPSVTDGQVKLKVAWTGICGSDLHEYMAGPIFIPTKEPHPLSHDRAPITMGHEFCGEVTEVGAGVTRFKPGDRVVIEPTLYCGRCPACRVGRHNQCEHMGFQGLSGGAGGFAAYSVADEHMVHHMPAGLSFEQGALVEPAAVTLHAVRISSLRVGDTAAVFGAGPIGLLLVESLRAAGASAVHVVELSPQRAAKALELGATTVTDPSKEDPVAKLRDLTQGGVHVAFEVTGVPAVLRQSIDATRFEGEAMVVSIWEKEASIQPNMIVMKERAVRGSIGYRHVFPAVMDLMQRGFYRAEQLVTKRIPLKDIVSEGFEALVRDKQQVKILVEAPPG